MAHRWLPVVPVAFSLCGLGIGLLIMGCSNKPHVEPRPATATESFDPLPARAPAAAAPTALANAPSGERTIDTTTSAPAPITTSRFAKTRNKPGSDENLPSWVPLRGRLTVVEAPDLAENLGIVPKGTTKNAQARISVADALDKNAGAGAAQPAAAQPIGATWLAANGRMRHGRSHR